MLGTCSKCILLLIMNVSIAAAIDHPASPSASYSIPLIDLNEQQERQVTVDRETAQYLGHPTTLLLEDGKTILCVYPKGHGRGAILYKRSKDGGKTWSERLPTPENWATSLETPTLHRVVDAKGKKRIILFSGLYPVRMAVSEDDGESWSELKAGRRLGWHRRDGLGDRIEDRARPLSGIVPR